MNILKFAVSSGFSLVTAMSCAAATLNSGEIPVGVDSLKATQPKIAGLDRMTAPGTVALDMGQPRPMQIALAQTAAPEPLTYVSEARVDVADYPLISLFTPADR